MTTRIEKTDLARDALYNKVNTMIDEVNTKIDNKDSLPSQTGNVGKFLTTDGTNASWGEVKQIEIKQDLTNPSADTVPSTKAVKDESSRITTLMNTKVSNCITEIPQDIKLELNNGTLTLKAGSKVYVPNGAGKFDVVTVQNDVKIVDKSFGSGTFVIFSSIIGVSIRAVYKDFCTSGTTAPTDKNYRAWYDTTNNLIKSYSNGAYIDNMSFPLAICNYVNGTGFTSIDQVFNGFGYIGNTVFALPGVKGLMPNGRNADGSLKSVEFTLDKVTSKTHTSGTYVRKLVLASNNIDGYINLKFDELSNYNIDNGMQKIICDAGTYITDNGKITSFIPKTVFHALDYNDKSIISGWSMPSSKYIDLTLGASGSTYTAPANGWVILRGNITNAQNITLARTTFGMWNDITERTTGIVDSSASNIVSIPVRKGNTFQIIYTGTVDLLRFIYAEGEE